ncbi:MFS transporter [Arthrobacter castelli]|uniref:MFS transporter n=1 Tax=Arthrobacter castelli TaxID=271431 RepID=UPI00047B3D3D|nr:MFS transporter [Arthrobacter castelli]
MAKSTVRSYPRRQGRSWLVLGLLCLAQFMVILDTTIVNVALPSIRSDLGFESGAGLQYVISLYALTFGGCLILAGRAADLFGRRRIFVTGLVVFALSSIVCGLAPTPSALLIARMVQGLGSAMTSAAALALLLATFQEGPDRNRALGAWGAVGGAAGACGLVLGGLLTAVAWPWVFFINVPVAIIAAIGSVRLLPGPVSHTQARRLDLPGAGAVTAGLGLLILGLTRIDRNGFTAVTVTSLAGSLVLLAVFVWIERQASDPLVRFSLFRTPGVAGANLVLVIVTAIVASNLFFTTLYVQRIIGYDPVLTGLAFLPNSLLVVLGSTGASHLLGRASARAILTTGLTILAAGSLLLSLIPTKHPSYMTDVLPGFALTGLGLGLAIVATTTAATRGINHHDQGLASGLVNTAQQVGFAVGIAAIVAVATAVTNTASGQTTERLITGYTAGYLTGAALAALAALITLVTLPGREPHKVPNNHS